MDDETDIQPQKRRNSHLVISLQVLDKQRIFLNDVKSITYIAKKVKR
jgi:hypothetical protein